VLVGDDRDAVAIARVASAAPFAPNGLFADCDRRKSCGRDVGDSCRRFEIDRRAHFPDGTPVAPGHVILAWEQGLRRGGGPHRWLLEPVRGSADVVHGSADHVSGLRAEGDDLVVCFHRETPDWRQRLSHPELWVRREVEGDLEQGAGPFRWDGGDVLEANPYARRASPRLEGVRLVRGDDRSRRFFEDGEADLGVVYGRRAAALLAARPSGFRAERAAGWDKSYGLWFDSNSRWVSDPAFRTWIGAVVDRETMLALLFDGQGELVEGLADGAVAEFEGVVPPRPFGASSAPHLSLAYDAGDRDATRIAARIKAVLEAQRVAVELKAVPHLANHGSSAAVLIVHRPPVEDPLLGLQDTLSPLGPSARATMERLQLASRDADPARRSNAANVVWRELLARQRIVPLLRLHAWFVVDSRVKNVEPARWSRLDLQSARWSR